MKGDHQNLAILGILAGNDNSQDGGALRESSVICTCRDRPLETNVDANLDAVANEQRNTVDTFQMYLS